MGFSLAYVVLFNKIDKPFEIRTLWNGGPPAQNATRYCYHSNV